MGETSPEGAPLMSGKGVQHVRERVAQEFEKARSSGATSLVQPMRVKTSVMTDENRTVREIRLATEPKPQPSLQQRAEILAKTVPTSGSIENCRRNVAECWNIGDAPVVENVDELFDAALSALGYASAKQSLDLLRNCTTGEPKKPSVWNRDILRRTR